MKVRSSKILSLLLIVFFISRWTPAKENYFPSFADKHTVGLWLFDETDYPYTTLTDAGMYEYDLRLMKGGKLVKGRYGNSLKLTPGLDFALSYAAFKGSVGFDNMRENSGKPGSGLFGPTIAPKHLLKTMANRDFTCEFWIKLMSNPIKNVALIDLGNKYEPGFTLTLKKRARGFVIENAYAGFKAVCPTVLQQIWGRQWHHIAFTHSAGSDILRYYIDGQAQKPVRISTIGMTDVPASVVPQSRADTTYGIFQKENRTEVPNYEIRRANRFNFAIGHNRRGQFDFNGNIDELRFSDVIRYTGNFDLPDSFSRNYGKDAPGPYKANGGPILFGPDSQYLPNQPVKLGSRKHIFIDEVMLERKENVKLTLNPPQNPVKLNIKAAWDASFFENDKGQIITVKSEGYEGDEAPIELFVSNDGVNFDKPDLGLIEYHGSKNNNLIMLGVPSWGKYFRDTNPAIPCEERYKATLWVAQRGIYMYVSPDAVHWRRNETCMMPLVSGGGCETFWDDQQGLYFNYIKRDGSYSTGDFPNYGRSVTIFKTSEPTKPWPINKVPDPYFEGWPFPAVTGEGLTVMGPDITDPDRKQIFRTRPQKYPWAPDTYLAFLIRGGADMAVSRDAINWTICSDNGLGYYLPDAMKIDGKKLNHAIIANGLIKRRNKIWQYANCSVSGERGVATYRVEQRLDGFMSLNTGQDEGLIITRPFIFEGDKLTLNVDASRGWVKVGIMDLPGRKMSKHYFGPKSTPAARETGYGAEDCDPIKADSVRQVVTWNGDSNVSGLSDKVIRLRFEMKNAKLFAFQFE